MYTTSLDIIQRLEKLNYTVEEICNIRFSRLKYKEKKLISSSIAQSINEIMELIYHENSISKNFQEEYPSPNLEAKFALEKPVRLPQIALFPQSPLSVFSARKYPLHLFDNKIRLPKREAMRYKKYHGANILLSVWIDQNHNRHLELTWNPNIYPLFQSAYHITTVIDKNYDVVIPDEYLPYLSEQIRVTPFAFEI